VREVDQLQDPVDERVAEGDKAVDGAVGQPDEEDLDEVARRLDEVDEEPDYDQADEGQAEQRRGRGPLRQASLA